MTEFRLRRVTTRSGTVVELPKAGVLCVVGGNNVGKSQFLRDIPDYLRGLTERIIILDHFEYDFSIPPEDVAQWFENHSVLERQPGQPDVYRPPGGGQPWQLQQLVAFYGDGASNVQVRYILDWFVKALDSAERAAVATSSIGQPGMSLGGGALHYLFRDGDLEQRLSDICERTFGFPLTLDRVNGDVLLRVGRPGLKSPPLQHPTREYADAVLALAKLSEQGDGVKNYLGMVLHLMTGLESVTIVDEPEAFLHPAQARALGRHLGNEALKHDRQLLTATHDRDFVLGLLETACPITFLRLNRSATGSSAATLSSTDVKGIWDKPALR